MNLLTVAPVLLPLVAAAAGIVLWGRPGAQRAAGIAGCVLSVIASALLTAAVVTGGTRTVLFGGWPEPFAIRFVADILGCLLVTVTALVGLAAVLTERCERRTPASPATAPFIQILLAGVSGAFLTGDLFNLYVWFEVFLIASFVLLVVEGDRSRLQGAFQYVVLNLLGSLVFLSAVGLVYGLTRSLNFAVLSERMMLAAVESPDTVRAIAGLFLVAFALKAGAFPLFYWLPVSYPGLPAGLGALFAGLLTKVGVYALLRIFTLVVPPGVAGVFPLLLGSAALTMVVGVLAAFSRREIRSILSFHIVSQIGYMVLGIGLIGSPDRHLQELGVAATVFYIVHHILVKANLFLIGGAVGAATGSTVLSRTGGLLRSRPLLAGLFLVPALSLAGIPPLSGFWAKLTMIQAGLEARQHVAVACALFAGLFTLLSMVKIWNEAFWKAAPDGPVPAVPPRAGRGRLLPIAGLAALTLALGAFPGPLLRLAQRSAQELLVHRTAAAESALAVDGPAEAR